MTEDKMKEILCESAGMGSDIWFMICQTPQLDAMYKKACFDETTRGLIPRTKIWAIVGEMSASFPVFAYFAIQNDDEAHGGGHLCYKVIEGTNHFVCGPFYPPITGLSDVVLVDTMGRSSTYIGYIPGCVSVVVYTT